MADIKIKKGYDLELAGAPNKIISENILSENIILKPNNFPGIKPKLNIKVNDKVDIGSIIFYDKNNEDINFTSPISGEISSIDLGERRSIESINIIRSVEQNHVVNKLNISSDIDSFTDEKIKSILCTLGYWPCIRQRPFSKIANPNKRPKSVFVSLYPTAPFAPDYALIMEDQFDIFHKGLEVIKKISNAPIHLVTSKTQKQKYNKIEIANVHTITGPHPAGNVGVHIYNIDPIKNKEDVVWYISGQDLLSIGRLFITGVPDYTKYVSVGGSKNHNINQYYKILWGTPISYLISDNMLEDQCRLVSGDIFSGEITKKENPIGFYDETVSIVSEKGKRELLGWLLPGFKKYSLSRTFVSSLINKKNTIFNTNKNGSKRAIIPIGNIEKYLPLDVLITPLLKAIIARDIDTMEKLGIYECSPEDFSLCTFVDASKMNIGRIIQDGLDIMELEG